MLISTDAVTIAPSERRLGNRSNPMGTKIPKAAHPQKSAP
jgi:hypothetical protein